MSRPFSSDRGAAFPLYIWMVTGLLLLAFVFFVFAQTMVSRNGTQSAADAAALAAAQTARDAMFGALVAPEDGEGPQDGFDGLDEAEAACAEAERLAAINDARVTSCDPSEAGTAYTVSVVSAEGVGDSVIPGTEDWIVEAEATAVIGALCEDMQADGEQIDLSCEDGDWTIDPGDPENMPEPRDLFDVFLED